jgi:uncharacterized membrane protein YkvA (DUF1232 family)
MGISHWKAKAKELKREAYALYLCARHPRTPLHAKLFALLIVSYAMSPIDLIPDFIPVIGYIDDLVLIPLGIALLIKMMPKDVLEECRVKAQSLEADKPMGWIGAAIVICIWAVALYVTYRLLTKML